MELMIEPGPEAAARRAASLIASGAQTAIRERGRFIMAVSGGRTPGLMLRALAAESLPWSSIHIVQVDERIAPEGHPDRNLTDLRAALLEHTTIPPDHIHPMPVNASNPVAAAAVYASTLRDLAGSPPAIDLVHLGLGADGHTASLIPNDPVLSVLDSDIALTGVYQGRHRMTLTYPILNRARRIMWLVTGSEKAEMLERLLARDSSIPAGRIRQDNAFVIADQAAAYSPKP